MVLLTKIFNANIRVPLEAFKSRMDSELLVLQTHTKIDRLLHGKYLNLETHDLLLLQECLM